MKKQAFYIISAVLMAFTACETDFDVNQNWSEIPVVYGLLNTADSVTTIRVQKAFLGDGDAFVFASNSDSIYYGDVLKVKLEEWKNGSFVDSILLDRDTTTIKNSGLFSNSPSVLYRADTSFSIKRDSDYKLEVKNTSTGKKATSETQIVDRIIVSKPPQSATAKISLSGNFPYVVTWLSAENGKVYDLVIRFFYEEVNKADPTQKEVKYVDWFFPTKTVTNSSNPTTIETEIAPGSFYTFLASQLSVNPAVDRFYCHLDFIFSVGADDLYTYVQVNEPPLGIVQEKPQFSNIDGGLGIFSSRLNFVVENKQLDSQSTNELILGDETKNLGFIGASNGCQ